LDIKRNKSKVESAAVKATPVIEVNLMEKDQEIKNLKKLLNENKLLV